MPTAAKQKFNQRFPSYIPVYYRVYILWRKIIRQTITRLSEKNASRQNCPGIISDGEGIWRDLKKNPIDFLSSDINRGSFGLKADLNLPQIKAITQKLSKMKAELDRRGLKYCSAAGTFINNTYNPLSESKKLWEDTWILNHIGIKPGMHVLDIGGASTPFSFYLASNGCKVDVIDNDWGNCGIIYNANYVAKKMGWKLKALDQDIASGLPFAANQFDRVFSICVIEHLTSQVRRKMMQEIQRVLKPGGIAGLTTDYDHRRKVCLTDKGLRFGYAKKFYDDVLAPSGLQLMGNLELIDANPSENFLGAFFLRKV